MRFLRGAVKACRSGVGRSHLISYQDDGALVQELFSRDGIGTQIVMESAEQIRRANINDIGGILELIRPLEQQGILVRRSREQLEREIDQFTIIERDNLTIACAALYPFPEERIGEMACVAVHPDYRSSSRGEALLKRVAAQARQMGLEKLFVLTTRSIHWFQERGFTPAEVDVLPMQNRSCTTTSAVPRFCSPTYLETTSRCPQDADSQLDGQHHPFHQSASTQSWRADRRL